MNGVLIIDKPGGMTSHDVVNRVRRILQQPSVGHLGTLDPLATGVLPAGHRQPDPAGPVLRRIGENLRRRDPIRLRH